MPLLSFVFDVGTIIVIWVVKNTLVSHQDFAELRERVVSLEARPVVDMSEIAERLGAIDATIKSIDDLQKHNRDVLESIQAYLRDRN